MIKSDFKLTANILLEMNINVKPKKNQLLGPKEVYCPYISEIFIDETFSPSMFPFFTLHAITINLVCAGISRFRLLMWGHTQKMQKQKPHKLRLLSSG